MLGLGLSFAKQTAKVFSYIKDKLKAYYRFYDTQPDFLLDGSTSFDGSNDYIDTGSSFSGVFGDGTTDNGFTITCWVNKPEDSSGLYGVCGKTFSDLAIRLMSNGRVQVFLRDVGGSAYLQREPTSVIGSGWHHLAVTYDGSRTVDGIKIYGDAVAVSGGNGTSGTFNAHANTSNNFQIGNTNGGSYMTGDMACFGVWNRELSASEIESIRWRGAYSELKDTELTNLVSWYDLQGDVLDKQGSNDGTNNGATLNSDSYSGESPFKPRIQDKAHPKMAVQLADGSTSFDGTDDYIELPTFSDTTALSVTGWIYLDASFSGRVYFINSGDFDLNVDFFSTTGEMRVNRNNALHPRYTNISTNQWVHLAVTTTNKTADPLVYFNGSLQSGTGNTDYGTLLGSGTFIGQSGSGNYFKGKMANVAIHSSALTQTQIQELMFTEKYSGLSADLKTNLVSWYDLGSEDVTASQTELIDDVSNRTFETGDGNSDWVNVTCDVFDDTNDLSIETSGSQYCKLNATYINGGNGFELNKRYRLTFDASGVSGLPRWGTAPTRTYAYISNGTNQTLEFTCLDADSGLFLSTNSGGNVNIDNISVVQVKVSDSHGSNTGEVSDATINTGYTYSPHGVVDPLNFGEVYSGRALSFDGSNDDATIGDIGATMYAMSFWFESNADISASSGLGHPICLTDDHSYGGIYFGGFTGSLTNEVISIVSNTASKINYYTSATDVIPDDMWHHLGITWDSSNSKYKIYLDGNELPVTESGGTISPIVCDYVMLGKRYSGHHLYAGKLNNIKIFNTALTESQLRELYTKPETVLPTGVSASNLKLDLPMQEGSGSYIYDGSSNQNHGTINGATWESGQEYGYQASLVRSNTPMIFSGDDYVSLGTPSALDINAFTISTWVKLDSVTEGTIFGEYLDGNNYSTVRIISGKVYCYGFTGGNVWEANTSGTITTGQWYHIVATCGTDTSTPIIYIDGSAVGLENVNGSAIGTAKRIGHDESNIGRWFPTIPRFLNGIISELAIWNTNIDSDAVTQLYNSGVPLLPTSDSGNYDNSSNLVGYWRNDGNTTWTDRSTNSNNGTAGGSPVSILIPEGSTEGRDNQGYYLSDTTTISNGIRLFEGEYIEVDDSEVLQNIFDGGGSVEVWIYAKGWGESDTGRIITKCGSGNSNGWNIFIENGGRLYLRSDWSTTDMVRYATSAINLNQWHHIAITYNSTASAGTDPIIYVDGVSKTLSGTASAGTVVSDAGQKIRIGARGTGLDREFDGLIDEVRLYDKILSADEVTKNYNNGKSSHQ